MHKQIVFIFSIIFTIFSFSQESTMGSKDRKYCKTYFYAEKHKLLEDYEAALQKYQDCIKINPNESSAFFEIAKIFFLSFNAEEAEVYALRATEIDGKNKWYLHFLITLYQYQLDYQKEAEIWEKLIKQNPLNLPYYYEASYAYLKLKNYKKALKILSNYEKKVGYSDLVFELKSKIFKEQGDYKKQEKCLKKGAETFPKSIFLLEELAQYYIEKSEYDLANLVYQKIVKINPDNSTALLASYTISRNQGLKEEEKKILIKIINSENIKEYQKQELLLDILTNEDRLPLYYEQIPYLLEKCISLYPESSFFYSILADFYSLDQKYILARDYYLLAINYEPNSLVLWDRLIYMSLLGGNYKQVIIDADLALSLFPLQGNFYYYKGLAEFYEKDYNESITSLNTALLYIIDDTWLLARIYETLGGAYHELAEKESSYTYHEKSDHSYQKALEYEPNNEYILNNYSYYLSLRGDKLSLAKEMIERCISMSKTTNTSFLDTYAWVLFKLKEYAEAEKIIKKCIQFGGNSAIILEHHGDILEALGLLEQAIIEWEKSLKKDPLNDRLIQKILDKKND